MSERAGEELSAEARQLIAAARGADDPTAEDEARVKARWLAGIAAGAGVSSMSEAVRAAASTGWSWGLKAAMLGGAAAIAAVGIYLGWPRAEAPTADAPLAAPQARGAGQGQAEPTAEGSAEEEQPSSAPAAPPVRARTPESAPAVEREEAPPSAAPDVPEPLAAAPAIAEPTLDTGSTVPSSPPEAVAVPVVARATSSRQQRVSRSRTKTGAKASRVVAKTASTPPAVVAPVEATPAPSPTGQLGEEIARLSEVRAQLQAGSPARALELLSAYRSRFAAPNLAMEADALQVDALCKAGKREAARAAAAAFTKRWPASPLEQRVSSACQ